MTDINQVSKLLDNANKTLEGLAANPTPTAISSSQQSLKELFLQGTTALTSIAKSPLNPQQAQALAKTATSLAQKISTNRLLLEQAGIPAAAFLTALQELQLAA